MIRFPAGLANILLIVILGIPSIGLHAADEPLEQGVTRYGIVPQVVASIIGFRDYNNAQLVQDWQLAGYDFEYGLGDWGDPVYMPVYSQENVNIDQTYMVGPGAIMRRGSSNSELLDTGYEYNGGWYLPSSAFAHYKSETLEHGLVRYVFPEGMILPDDSRIVFHLGNSDLWTDGNPFTKVRVNLPSPYSSISSMISHFELQSEYAGNLYDGAIWTGFFETSEQFYGVLEEVGGWKPEDGLFDGSGLRDMIIGNSVGYFDLVLTADGDWSFVYPEGSEDFTRQDQSNAIYRRGQGLLVNPPPEGVVYLNNPWGGAYQYPRLLSPVLWIDAPDGLIDFSLKFTHGPIAKQIGDTAVALVAQGEYHRFGGPVYQALPVWTSIDAHVEKQAATIGLPAKWSMDHGGAKTAVVTIVDDLGNSLQKSISYSLSQPVSGSMSASLSPASSSGMPSGSFALGQEVKLSVQYTANYSGAGTVNSQFSRVYLEVTKGPHVGLQVAPAHTRDDGVAEFRFSNMWIEGTDEVRVHNEANSVSAVVSLTWLFPTGGVGGVPGTTGVVSCPLPQGQITPLTSRVENPQLSHIHTATDFSISFASSCGSCGGGSAVGGSLATDLKLERFHRYADQFRAGSFGPGVFSNLDVSLTLWNDGEAGEIWDPTGSTAIPLTPSTGGIFLDTKRSAIKTLALLKPDGSPAASVTEAATATATQHDGSQWIFELVQAGTGGPTDRHGRLTAIRDRVGNQLTIAHAFSAAATDVELGGARSRLLEMASATDQRGRILTFTYGWSCGQPVITQVRYPTGEVVIYHYDGDIAGVCRIDYPDSTTSTFDTRLDAVSQTQVVDYQDAGAEGTHRTKSVYLSLADYVNADGATVVQPVNRVRRVVGPTGEPTYLNWIERTGSQVRIYVYEGGGIGGTGRVYRLDTTEGVTDTTWVASSWSFATDPTTWTWEKVADYQTDALFRMGQQVDSTGKSTAYDRDPASGAITGRTHRDAGGNVVSRETTQYNALRQPIWHVDANNMGTRSIYDDQGSLLFRTEGIVVAEDGTEDASNAVTSSWTYRSDGQVESETDALNNTTTYEYDIRGFRTAEVSPPDDPAFPDIRSRKTWHFDAAGRLDVSTDAAGHSTTYIYDSRNRVTEIRYGNGSKETMVYGTGADANLLKSKTDRDGVVTTFDYDAAGREFSRTEGAQDPIAAITTTTTYLEGTDLPQTVTRAGQKTEYIYDTRKRVTETRRWVDGTRYLAESTVFDAADHVAYTQDAFNRRTYSVYDDLDRVVRTIRESVAGGVPTGVNLVTLARITTENPAYVIEETSFDAGGRVLTTTDARGIITKMGYDALGRVTDRWEAFGTADEGHWQTQYDDAGNRLVEIDPLDHETHYTYNGRNLLESQTVAYDTTDAATTSFTYTLTGQRASQTDPNNNTTYWTYGHCCDWLKDVTDPAGFVTSYTYTLGGKVATVTDPNTHVTTTHYDALGRPFEQIDGRGKASLTTFDDNLSDGVGLDAAYAVELATLADRTGFHAVAKANPLNETVVQVSDALGRQVLSIDQARHVTVNSNDVQTLVEGVTLVGTAMIDPLGNRTSRYADGLGRTRVVEMPTGVQLPPPGVIIDSNLLDGVGIDAEYNLGNLGDITAAIATKTVDIAGYATIQVEGITSYTTSTIIGPFGGTGGDGSWYATTDWDLVDGQDVDADYLTNLENAGFYDRFGMWADKSIDGDGWVTLTVYQQTPSSAVLGPYAPLTMSGRIAMAYDANGNQLSVTDALGHTQSSVFDARNRQVATTDAAGNTTGATFDAVGNVVAATDGFGHATAYTYTARNQKASETDRLGHITTFSYDSAGNLLTISDAENEAKKGTVTPEVYDAGKTRYTYTERNQLWTETFPGATGGTRTYGYWPNGQLKTRLDQRGITTTYIYDPANRLTDRTYSDGTADHFVLDDAGRITSATASRSGVVVARQYFPTGLIKEEQTTWPAGISGTPTTTLVGFGYDAANRETTLTLPDGRTIDRTFTNRNELRSLAIGGQSIATLGYDNGGRRTSTAFANGLTDTRAYTANNLLESTTVAAGAAPAVVALSYSYDLNRRKLAETDSRDTTRTQSFGYDFNDRLTSWSTGATPRLPAAQTWELSPVGDWTTNTVDGVTETRTHTAVHEIKTSNGLPLGYDAAGNLTRTAEDQRFTWDAENRLLAAEAGPNPDQAYGVAHYSHDAFGRRVAKRVFGTTTLFVHAGNWQVVQEIDAPTVASPADKASDGDLASLGIVPDGAILWPTWDAEGNRLDPIRVNMQPESTEIPDGFLADKGRDLDLRTNGLTYGWSAPEGSPTRPEAQTRHFMPMPQYDTLAHLGTAGQEWKIALPNGSYPVVVVCGDPTSLAHTNNLVVNGQPLEADPDPGDDTTVPAYQQGDFDGYAVQVEVTDGFLTIAAGAGAFDPTLCFIEIGAEGTELTQDIKDWLADQVDAATKRTGGSPFWNGGREETRSYVWGSGIDELVGYQRTTVAAGTSTYYIHAGAQWSVQAVTDASGQVVERRQYTAYGKQVLDNADSSGRSVVGLTTGWTGRAHDEATGTIYFRNREWGTDRFLNRDPAGYVDGYNLYAASFVPNSVDPLGLWLIAIGGTDSRKDFNERHILGFVRLFSGDYDKNYRGHAYYHEGPDNMTLGTDSSTIEKAAYDWLNKHYSENGKESIDMVGHSRGGYIVMQLARRIKRDGLDDCGVQVHPRIRFMGLYDPVDSAPGYGVGNGVPDNVLTAAVAFSAEGVHSRERFHRVGHTADNPFMTTYTSQDFWATHGGMGGDPWGGDHPVIRVWDPVQRKWISEPTITKDQDEAGSRQVDGWVRAQARAAGVKL